MQIHIEDEVQKFIESLETQAIAKTLRTIDLLERFGNKLTMPHSKQVSGGLFELRMRGIAGSADILLFSRRCGLFATRFH